MRWDDGVSVPVQNTNVKLHKVVILDGSGSMSGSKYNSAEAGVRLDYDNCKSEFVDYRLCEFSDSHTEVLHDFTKPLQFRPCYGNTALYSTIWYVLSNVIKVVPKSDKVLVQIFTDGQDNISKRYKSQARSIIKQFNLRGWTVTFVGTQDDVEYVQRQLSIDSSNTLVHDNTASGITKSFDTYLEATRSYTKNVAKGKSVTTNFFKSTKND